MSFLQPGKPDGAECVGEELDRLVELCEMDFIHVVFTDWETEFLELLGERLGRYGERTFISPKQWEVIERIKQRIADA